MNARAEPIRVVDDDATAILQALTSSGVEPNPDLSRLDEADARTGRPIMWF